MKHVLITRFALRFEEGNPRRRYEGREWVQYRMELFKKYTLPSVQAQTYQDFDWWFLVDFNFPGFMNKDTKELNKYGKCMFITDPWEEKQKGVAEYLSKYYKDEWVCSTRLDSDDIISNDFMKNLHELVWPRESYVTFHNGYMMKGDKVCERSYTVNPFVSYVEYADPFQSVFRTCHTKVDKQDAPLLAESVPSWIQVDHGDNIKNRVKRKIGNFKEVCFPASDLRDRFTWGPT